MPSSPARSWANWILGLLGQRADGGREAAESALVQLQPSGDGVDQRLGGVIQAARVDAVVVVLSEPGDHAGADEGGLADAGLAGQHGERRGEGASGEADGLLVAGREQVALLLAVGIERLERPLGPPPRAGARPLQLARPLHVGARFGVEVVQLDLAIGHAGGQEDVAAGLHGGDAVGHEVLFHLPPPGLVVDGQVEPEYALARVDQAHGEPPMVRPAGRGVGLEVVDLLGQRAVGVLHVDAVHDVEDGPDAPQVGGLAPQVGPALPAPEPHAAHGHRLA
ncbi:MAG: hypothetical protein HYU66_17830, partial [Armatimonadetes bacterium]|nr:hypothetical protein [Armatimonadota bacterium]